jgi:hypothetical protein
MLDGSQTLRSRVGSASGVQIIAGSAAERRRVLDELRRELEYVALVLHSKMMMLGI